jgi:DNA repair protein RecO (recombination protein O)
MPLYRAEALVLRTYRLGEADRIGVFLTRDRGKKRGVARGARKSRRRFAGALEPFTRADVTYFETETRELVRLDEAVALESPFRAPSGDGFQYVSYFAELVDAWAQDSDPNETLFRLGAATLDAVAAGVPATKLARYFELWLLRLQGVYPSLRNCQRCGAALAGRGAWLARPAMVLLCDRCRDWSGAADLSPGALAFLGGVAAAPPAGVAELPWSSAVAREVEAVHRAILMAHLEREPRASRVLRAIERSEPFDYPREPVT